MNRLPYLAASQGGIEIDHLIWALLGVSAAVLALVFGLLSLFVIRYRASNPRDRGGEPEKSWRIEIGWTAATLVVFFGLFLWSADLYVRLYNPPDGAYRIYVVGKQWMWKFAYPDGQHEINTLHIPVGRPVQLIMTSEDVIHDLSIPAFRIKHDVLPGRYDTIWFQATEPGVYHLFCTQFCGTDHAAMTGSVVAMIEPDFSKWLAEQNPGVTPAAAGRALFIQNGCDGCHGGKSTVPAPSLIGLYGASVALVDGTRTTADERYLHDAILHADRQRVAGYQPVMPSFAGQIPEDDVLQLIAYVKSLGNPKNPSRSGPEKEAADGAR